jgi:hypothetical protein
MNMGQETKRKRTLRQLVAGCGIFLTISIAFVPCVTAQVIPPVSGRVVDAVT